MENILLFYTLFVRIGLVNVKQKSLLQYVKCFKFGSNSVSFL